MEKQISFILILTFLTANIHFGQNYFVSNIHNNIVFSNPSIAGFNDYSILQMNYRNQWPVDGLYNSFGISYFNALKDFNSNIGGMFNYDRQLSGLISAYSTGINYAFKLKTNTRDYLIFGIAGLYNFHVLDYSQLVFENLFSSYSENQLRHFPVFNVGVSYLLRESHLVGVSVNNVYPLTDPSVGDRKYYLTYLGRIGMSGYKSFDKYIEPLAVIWYSQMTKGMSIGANIGFYNFKSGILLSQSDLKISSTTFLLGISFENYEFIYCYDLNLSGVVTLNPKMAAHEVTFLSKFQYKRRRKRHRAIKCPDI